MRQLVFLLEELSARDLLEGFLPKIVPFAQEACRGDAVMHPLHNYLAKQLAERLKSKKIVVWYDPRADFTPFVRELCAGGRGNGQAWSEGQE